MLPETVATAVLLDVYVKAPVLLLEGGVIVKGAAPTDLLGILKPLNIGAFSTCFANTKRHHPFPILMSKVKVVEVKLEIW